LVYDANIVKKLDNDDEKISNLIRRRLPIDTSDIKYENKDSYLEISLPENTFLIEGIQIIKRGISTDIFKFIPSLKSVIFVEKYNNLASKPEASSPEAQTSNESDSNTDATAKKSDINKEIDSENNGSNPPSKDSATKGKSKKEDLP
ncbi:MAG: hypothetical protein M3Y25_03645, partial [Thermoproteota archaeon]|nr:hypothetical protein [Thermoproteota archaeon]